jgi:peptidoglycan/LPS O-acetylase OafA/YrhL
VAVFVAGTFIAAEILYRAIEQPLIRRYVRLMAARETPLCLSEVEIYASEWVAGVP